MATLYKTNGESKQISPKNGTDFQLEELQEIVGEYIDVIGLGDEIMVFNDEGKLIGLPLNKEATVLFHRHYDTDDFIVGDVLICKDNEID